MTWPDTLELVDWPLRNLKKLIFDQAYLNLPESDFPAVREKIERQNLKLIITTCDDEQRLAPGEKGKWTTELEFWKTVKSVEVTGLRAMRFGQGEDGSSSDVSSSDDGIED